MERKKPPAHAGLAVQWLFFIVFVVQANADDGSAHTRPHYKECSLGKGQVKIYNCGNIYDINGTGVVQLQNFKIPARYLIKLKDNETSSTVNAICDRAVSRKSDMYSGTCIYKYTTVWLGMLILINGGNLSQLLSKEATSVDFVEVDGKLRVCGSTVQGNPPSWGLDRIDHFAGQSLLNGLYTSTSSGTGVHVYVLDTGIRCSHKEFRYQDGRLNKTTGIPLSRCLDGFDGIQDGNGTSDCNGHGTHCAGIVGGVRTGVAKDVLLHPVRIMGCDGSGSYGALIAGLDWVSVNLIRPAVLSMSVSTRASISIDQAINNMVNRTGVIGIAAAGNLMQEACNFSPAHAASVITVGSTNSLNEMSWFSNYGPCTTMFAPGELVYSSYFQNDTSYATLSGTSMACPHVAGAAALYLSQNPLANPVDIRQSLMDATESNAVSTTNLKPGTTTRLLNTNTKQIFYRISPRSFYNASENSTYPVVVNLLIKPATTVFLTPEVDPTIGYFSPKLLLFPADATWSNSKTINLVLLPNSDYLDHSAPIQWIFNSKDTRFVASPEGWITAQDTGVCKKTATNRCGQDVDYPKVIPSLPFYYIDDSSQYQDIYNESFDARCHSNGPDLLFQYTPSANTFINISLCGATTQFDSLLSVYEYKKLEKKNLSLVAWNDDYCGSKSMLINVPMVAGHVYIIMIDGYHGGGGPLEIYIYGLGSPLVANPQPVPTSIPVMLSSFFTSIRSAQEICTLWKGADCPPVPAPLPIQAEFFWSPVRWGPCDKHCAGGLQQAVMQCFTGNYSKVDTWNCAQIPVPVIYQVCNLVACNNYTIFEGPWDECNRSCGAGIQKRQVICMDNMGNTAHPERCGGEIDSDIIQTCNQQACNESRWEVAPWDFCNVPCAGGRKYRTTACYLNGAVVDDGMCDNLFAPLRELECNTQPCQTYAWLIGRWEDCPYVCNATKDRVVACVDGGGQVVADSFCDPGTKPKSRTACQQPSLVCDYCGYNNCSNNGQCKNGTCACMDKWGGDYCERPLVCKGNPIGVLKDGSVGCCPYATIDVKQHCCLYHDAFLDVNGACCVGSLDACGICNGPHISVDSQNQCCPSIRDEKGICCLSGRLDECYICDGDGTTCATNVSMLAHLDDSLDVTRNSSVNWKAFMIDFMMKVAARLQVATEALVLTGVETMNTLVGDCSTISEMKLGCLGTGHAQLLAIFNFSVLPIPLVNLTFMTIEEADVSKILMSLDDTPNGEFIKGLKIKEVQHVARAGVCGNGMCERGERCSQNGQSSTTDGPCCSADCPYVPIACPITLDGPRSHVPCSKNGICHDASGQCDCFEGYQGDACDMCLKGYVMIPPGQCLKVPDALVLKNLSMSFNVSVKSTDGNVPKGSSAGSAIGVIICIIIFGGAFYMCWKTYGQSISSGPAAQGALQALGLGGASNAQDAGNISGGAEVESGSWNETSAGRANRQARRNSLKEERREAVEERRKSRTHGPEHSAVRKSLMMTQDAFGGVGAGRPQSPPGFSPAPMSQQQWPGGMMGDGGVISNVRRSLVGESNNYARLDAPGGYKDEEPSYRPYTRNEEPPSYKDISKDEDRRYQNFPSSSSNFFDGPPSPSNSDIL
ncbi:hypothetical protein MPTK1_3g13090 [Marchantia polymorpha subsp. ruderalis]|uniref:EGF-like domain-containing protein n=2 Tax=Marchantia polymorpha TaxID=3197 RepID=A0AAF6B0A2_MARPO|nr:hypothetical protein MARPO_0050s0101 [Marchantia polymorpha]BBN05436.1 hypothetical protein Mp_3g13090 [Marchantia polymorpha subsp. ruderalis]|eukprot:PTQ38650.1 hypothetical protein MARPO_0050s0101 [Marchantia polymorpha]